MKPPRFGETSRVLVLPFLLALVLTIACYAASRQSLGFYFGPIVMSALVIPSLARARFGTLRVIAVIDAVAMCWLVAFFLRSTTFLQWLACYVVLVAFAFALLTWSRAVGATVITLLALAWLSWPVWLSAYVTGPLAGWLTPAHPLLAVNHVLLDVGVWTQERLMYQFTSLGQDVPYTLPKSIWPCVLLHAGIGSIALLPAVLRKSRCGSWSAGRRPASSR